MRLEQHGRVVHERHTQLIAVNSRGGGAARGLVTIRAPHAGLPCGSPTSPRRGSHCDWLRAGSGSVFRRSGR